jgi:hypothetical protein
LRPLTPASDVCGEALAKYRSLPQKEMAEITDGPALKRGSKGSRVALLRKRLSPR